MAKVIFVMNLLQQKVKIQVKCNLIMKSLYGAIILCLENCNDISLFSFVDDLSDLRERLMRLPLRTRDDDDVHIYRDRHNRPLTAKSEVPTACYNNKRIVTET